MQSTQVPERSRATIAGAAVPLAVAALAMLPVLAGVAGLLSNVALLQLTLILVYALAVLGLVLLTGFNGQISLGHGAFFAVGAYTAAILVERAGLPGLTTLPAVALVSFLAGYLFGLPALRLAGPYLALATFALAIAVPQMLKYRHLKPLTGGVEGIVLTKPAPPPGLGLSADQWMYLVTAIITGLAFLAARNLIASRMGRAMLAIREDPLAAAAMGVDVGRIKAIVFGLSALVTGLAGGLHALVFEYVSPDSFPFQLSIALLVGAVVGGIGSLAGALIGGVFVQVIERYADAISRAVAGTVPLPIDLQPWTIYGLLLIALMYVMPGGIAGALASLAAKLQRRARTG